MFNIGGRNQIHWSIVAWVAVASAKALCPNEEERDCAPGQSATFSDSVVAAKGLTGLEIFALVGVILVVAIVIMGLGWFCAMWGNFDLFINDRYDGYRRAPLDDAEAGPNGDKIACTSSTDSSDTLNPTDES